MSISIGEKMKKKEILFFILIICFITTLCHAALPRLITYQGKLSSKIDSQPLEGVQPINFKIYDALTGGNLLWQEDQNVLVEKGIFNVKLGSSTDLNLPFDKPYYLEIKINDEVITPRQSITSSGYAISADNLEGSITANQVGSGNVSNTEFEALNGVTGNIQTQINSIGAPDYDSGWFNVSGGGKAYVKNHGLGVVPSRVQAFMADSSGNHVAPLELCVGYADYGGVVQDINSASITAVTYGNGSGCGFYLNTSSGQTVIYTSGKYKILAWK
jgi:hypothetical protein